jgi:hypothetical protein
VTGRLMAMAKIISTMGFIIVRSNANVLAAGRIQN